MSRVLIYGGTTEGRRLAERLSGSGLCCTLCVATDYGRQVIEKKPGLTVCVGRKNAQEMRDFLEAEETLAVVDATHPYAVEVSENIKKSMEESPVPCFRLKRETQWAGKARWGPGISWYESHAACAKALQKTTGNILLTTGSRELGVYCEEKELQRRLFVRVLPDEGSIQICREQGLTGRQILALQGPFSAELNEALIRQYQICCLVTKESGETGGFPEKLEAAERTGIQAMVIGRPRETGGLTLEEVCREIGNRAGCRIGQEEKMQITLAGAGMGTEGLMTREVLQTLESADLVFGAKRLLSSVPSAGKKVPCYLAEDILPVIREYAEEETHYNRRKSVVALFSGDTGCYSGAQKLYLALQEEIAAGRLAASVRILPGISSVACLSARTGISWQDARIESIHGRDADVLAAVLGNRKIFLLMSGPSDVRRLGDLLQGTGLEQVRIFVGFQLSYPEEQVRELTAQGCRTVTREGLYTCLILNEASAEKKRLTHGIPDEEFIRGNVPMTKEEIREVSVCKLGLYPGAVLYDIGSGTGSIAVECAGRSESLRVFAIEQKEEAVSLIHANCKKFHVPNVTVVKGRAPEALEGLEMPTHAFLGGSGGSMKEILAALYRRNPSMRVALNAITLETLQEVMEGLSILPVKEESVVQLQTARSRKAGKYHLMQAENPVWIISFVFAGEDLS